MSIGYSSLHNTGFYRTARMVRVAFMVGTTSTLVVSLVFPVSALTIDATDQYAWGENVGWLVWGTSEGNVVIPDSDTDGELTGYVWGENVGWVSLNCSNTATCGTVDYHASRSQGEILGYAWGENIGWINFNCSNDASCGTVDFGVAIATASGEFSGYAWGENIGWINFNCSNDASCGTVDFKVVASPTPTATATPPPSGGGGSVTRTATPPPPTASPPPTPTATPTPVAPSPSAPPVGPLPSVAPGAPPGGGPSGPPPGRTPGPIDFVDRTTRRIDDFIGRIGEQPVESGAGVATAIALAPILWAAVEIVQTKSAAAAGLEMLYAFGLKKRPRVWGTVYDARTKHPIPFARVQILDEVNRVLETRFADRDGRYGFLLSAQGTQGQVRRVKLSASRDGYSFPSQLVSPGTDYLVYEHPYFGDVIEVSGEAALTHDIPLDPAHAQAGMKPVRPPFAAVISKSWETVLNVGFYVGLVLVPYNMILHPTTTNFIIGGVFFGANAFRIFKLYRPYGHVKDTASGKTIPFSLVTLHDQTGKRLSFSVSDEEGRYFLSTEGEKDYQIRVHTPANMIPPRTATEDIPSTSKEIKQGWITKKLKV